jgi:hypothetical protein
VWCMPTCIKKVTPINLIVRQYAHLKVKLWFIMLPYD